MGARHESKNQVNKHHDCESGWIENVNTPKQWRDYIFVFSTALLMVFCFLSYVKSTTIKDMVAAAGAVVEKGGLSSELSLTNDTCDFSRGKWVYDEKYPLYQPSTCPFVEYDCVENGRPNVDFQKMRWQPSGCDLPRFDAKEMLERLRGSRVAFVGDSIGRNQWESMMCMLAEVVPNKTRIYEINGKPIMKHIEVLQFRFEDYDCNIEYYRSPYLVPQVKAPPESDSRVKMTLKLDEIDSSASMWTNADIVVFNSGHWWDVDTTVRSGLYFQVGNIVSLNMTVEEAFSVAMKTMARFTEKSMDPAKSQLFFRSYSPGHFKGGKWDEGGVCDDETKPLEKFPSVYEDKTFNNMVLEAMAANMKNPVNFLNITYLSDLRPDGHPSIWKRVPPLPQNHQDCLHWCLAGVPDTWNEILFATLLTKGTRNWGMASK